MLFLNSIKGVKYLVREHRTKIKLFRYRNPKQVMLVIDNNKPRTGSTHSIRLPLTINPSNPKYPQL
jgi:hypothetical protein